MCLVTFLVAILVEACCRADDLFSARPQPWERRSRPILSATTTNQSWCKVVLYSPHVIYHDGRFRMWYLGTSSGSRANDIVMGYAESDNGIQWREHAANPILTGDDVPWGRILQTPYVLFDENENRFKMWFVSGAGVLRDANRKVVANDQQLGYATSADGIRWKVHSRSIYPSGRSPSVLKEGKQRYRMWMGSKPSSTSAWDDIYKNIYEFSSNDGIQWQRSGQPVIRPSGKGRSTVYPYVLKRDGVYHMWYGCHTDRRFEIFHATSRDGSQWSVNHDSPAFPARSEKDFFDSRYTSTPCIVSRPDRDLLYYSARDLGTTYLDGKGRKHRDGAGVYAHIGVATLKKP